MHGGSGVHMRGGIYRLSIDEKCMCGVKRLHMRGANLFFAAPHMGPLGVKCITTARAALSP